MVKELKYVVCPCCFMNKMKGKAKFGIFDLNTNFFLQERYIKGGKGHGGWFVDENKSLTIPQAFSNPEYRELIEQIYNFSKKYIKFVDGLKKTR